MVYYLLHSFVNRGGDWGNCLVIGWFAVLQRRLFIILWKKIGSIKLV